MKKVIRKNIADVKLPKDWGKVKMPESKVRYPDTDRIFPNAQVTVDESYFRDKETRAFPVKSFDSVLQPIVDVCIDEIENILKVWTKTR